MTASATEEARTAGSTVVPISAAEDEAFRRDGFLLLRGVVGPAEVETLIGEVDRLVREASATGSVLREPYYHENSYKLVRILRLSPVFDPLIDHPGYFGRLVSLIGPHLQLMGSEIFVRGASDESITGFHTDCGPGMQAVLPDDHNAFLQIKAQIFLTDLTRRDASNFALIPGSHKMRAPDRNPTCMLDSVNARMGPNGELPDEAVQVLANAGDVLLFPHSLWHAVARNLVGRTRYSIALRYGLTALRPMERFDPVLADETRALTPRQRRLLGDYGGDGTSPYRPPDQEAIIFGESTDIDGASIPAPSDTAARLPVRAAADDPVMRVAREALAAAPSECPRYLSALLEAVGEEPPPCGMLLYADMYRSASESAQWVVVSLLKQASRDGAEARRLWDSAVACGDATVRDALRRTAIDRSNHVLLAVEIVEVAFPGALSPELGEDLRGLAPVGLVDERLPDIDGQREAAALEDVVSLNLDGLRRTILTDLLGPAVLEHCADEPRAAKLLSTLRRDYLSQVACTAERLEAVADRGLVDALPSLLIRGLRSFNRQTSEEPVDLSYHHRFGSHP